MDTRDFHGHLYRLAELAPSVTVAGSWSGGSSLLTGAAGVDASKLWVRPRRALRTACAQWALRLLTGLHLCALAVTQTRTLSTMLLSRMQRQVDTERVAAFAKRLSTVRRGAHKLCLPRASALSRLRPQVACHAETGEAMSSLAVVCELLGRYQKLRRLLVRALRACPQAVPWPELTRLRRSRAPAQENDAGAARAFQPEAPEPESACALSSCLWELALLQRHAHPGVASLAAHVAAMPVEEAVDAAPYGSLSPEARVRLLAHGKPALCASG